MAVIYDTAKGEGTRGKGWRKQGENFKTLLPVLTQGGT